MTSATMTADALIAGAIDKLETELEIQEQRLAELDEVGTAHCRAAREFERAAAALERIEAAARQTTRLALFSDEVKRTAAERDELLTLALDEHAEVAAARARVEEARAKREETAQRLNACNKRASAVRIAVEAATAILKASTTWPA